MGNQICANNIINSGRGCGEEAAASGLTDLDVHSLVVMETHERVPVLFSET